MARSSLTDPAMVGSTCRSAGLVVDLDLRGIALHRVDTLQRGALALVGLAGGDHLCRYCLSSPRTWRPSAASLAEFRSCRQAPTARARCRQGASTIPLLLPKPRCPAGGFTAGPFPPSAAPCPARRGCNDRPVWFPRQGPEPARQADYPWGPTQQTPATSRGTRSSGGRVRTVRGWPRFTAPRRFGPHTSRHLRRVRL